MNNECLLSAPGTSRCLSWHQHSVNKAELGDLDQHLRDPGRLDSTSTYAANMANGVWNAKANLVAVTTLRLLLQKVRDAGCVVEFVHVKGHTADAGVDTSQAVLINGRADELAWWGKGPAPFSRLHEGGRPSRPSTGTAG